MADVDAQRKWSRADVVSPARSPVADIYLGRQPILDRGGALAGYELLFRRGQTGTAHVTDADEASALVLENTLGSHYMAGKLAALGHQVKLISPQFVRLFVKSNKNDFVDAEAICEAASRPAMRFVTPKTESQQTLSALHRVRESLVRDRTKTVNQMHGFLLEFGISLPVGKAVIARLAAVLAEHSLPPRLVMILERLHAHFKYLDEQITEVDKEMTRQLVDDDLGQRLLTIPGVGPVTASVLAAEMGDGKQYRCSRDFAASMGLVPRQYSTGGKANLLGISRRGDKNIRRLLVLCARAYMRLLDKRTGRLAGWVRVMLTRRHSNVVACALANKPARTAWAITAPNTVFDAASAESPAWPGVFTFTFTTHPTGFATTEN